MLHKAEKPWIPMAKRDNSGMISEEAQAAELYRKFLSILNKLTPQKFQALAEQALKLEINTEERLNGCIDMIFTKVCFFRSRRIICLTITFYSIGFERANIQYCLCQPV